jgi:hypothetical protein
MRRAESVVLLLPLLHLASEVPSPALQQNGDGQPCTEQGQLAGKHNTRPRKTRLRFGRSHSMHMHVPVRLAQHVLFSLSLHVWAAGSPPQCRHTTPAATKLSQRKKGHRNSTGTPDPSKAAHLNVETTGGGVVVAVLADLYKRDIPHHTTVQTAGPEQSSRHRTVPPPHQLVQQTILCLSLRVSGTQPM